MAFGTNIPEFRASLDLATSSWDKWERGPSFTEQKRLMRELRTALTDDHEGLMYEGSARTIKLYADALETVARLSGEVTAALKNRLEAQDRLNASNRIRGAAVQPYQSFYERKAINEVMFWLTEPVERERIDDARMDLSTFIRPTAETSYARFVRAEGPLVVHRDNVAIVNRLAGNWGVRSALKFRG